MTLPAQTVSLDRADCALLELLQRLRDSGYQFTTPAPSTHRRVLMRRGPASAQTLVDIFGWNMPFRPETLDKDLLWLMNAGDALCRQGRRLTSCIRVASLGPLLFAHSAFPTGKESVFFGPDSYRFAEFIRAELPEVSPGETMADIGAGAGVGGVFAHSLKPSARLVLGDVNPKALRLARINAVLAGQRPDFVEGEGLPLIGRPFKVVLANPPYIGGDSGKTYSDGGGALGGDLSIAWARQAVAGLKPGGRLLLYTGAAMVKGRDPLRQALADVARAGDCAFTYRELDPDVFPSTLLHRAYWGVERIAAVGAVLVKGGT